MKVMRQMMRPIALAVVLISVSAGAVFAQKEKTEKKEAEEKVVLGYPTKEKSEQEMITIRKSKSGEPVTIVIDNGKVTINGKPADDNKDVNVNIMRFGGQDFELNGRYFNDFSFARETAFLGVGTEPFEKGLKVISVSDNSGAEKAGLLKGDIITKIGDKKLESSEQLSKLVKEHKPGEKIEITYLRDNNSKTVTATLGKSNVSTVFADSFNSFNIPAVPVPPAAPNIRLRGSLQSPGEIVVSGYSNKPRWGFNIQDNEDGPGVKVVSVIRESNAEKAGLKEGDIITEIDGKEVNVDIVRAATEKARDTDALKLKVKRNNKTENIEVKTPKVIRKASL